MLWATYLFILLATHLNLGAYVAELWRLKDYLLQGHGLNDGNNAFRPDIRVIEEPLTQVDAEP